MFTFVRKHSQPIGDHPLTDTLFLYIAWKYKPSQPIGGHPLWPCPLRVVINFVSHSYIYIYIYIYVHRYDDPLARGSCTLQVWSKTGCVTCQQRHYKPSILGYPLLWKPIYIYICNNTLIWQPLPIFPGCATPGAPHAILGHGRDGRHGQRQDVQPGGAVRLWRCRRLWWRGRWGWM